MARKDLLKGLMGEDPDPASVKPVRYPRGAIGAVSQSIEGLKTRAVLDLDPHMIEAGGVEDRLEHDEVEHEQLMDAIRDYGQQVPVLVRPHPEKSERYQIVYGRRRVLAMRDLGLPVKAMVRDLDDQELVVAQGQENTARRDLSYIEKANFARQMVNAGYKRKIVCDALSIDKTVISRMLATFDLIPVELVRLIGAAPSVGRDRWTALTRLWEEKDGDLDTASGMIAAAGAQRSDDRFEAVYNWLEKRGTSPPPPTHGPFADRSDGRETIRDAEGTPIAKLRRKPRSLELSFPIRGRPGFEAWLVENIDEIHRRWKTEYGGEDPEQ